VIFTTLTQSPFGLDFRYRYYAFERFFVSIENWYFPFCLLATDGCSRAQQSCAIEFRPKAPYSIGDLRNSPPDVASDIGGSGFARRSSTWGIRGWARASGLSGSALRRIFSCSSFR
jgi:hypothetical protein